MKDTLVYWLEAINKVFLDLFASYAQNEHRKLDSINVFPRKLHWVIREEKIEACKDYR